MSVEKLKGATEPNHVQLRKRSLQYLAAIYATDKLNEPDKAEPVVKQLIDMDPKDTVQLLRPGRRSTRTPASSTRPRAQMKQAEAAAPNDPGSPAQLGEFYNRRGDFDKAMASFEQGHAARAEQPAELLQPRGPLRGEGPQGLHRQAGAEGRLSVKSGMAAIDKALEIRPDYFEALTYKNLLLRQQALLEQPARRSRSS